MAEDVPGDLAGRHRQAGAAGDTGHQVPGPQPLAGQPARRLRKGQRQKLAA